jgi:hypothetical protein
MRRAIALILAGVAAASCGAPSPEEKAVAAIRDNTLAEWPYSDDETVAQMEGMCRSLDDRSVAELLDAFAGQWSGSPSNEQTEHDYGILIRYSIEGVCPHHASLIRDPDYRGHPGWKGVYYGDERG